MSMNYGDAIQKLLGVNLGKITIKVGKDGEELTHETAKKKMRSLADMMNAGGKEGSYYDGRKLEDFDPFGDGHPKQDESKKQFGGVSEDSGSSGMESVSELFKTLPQKFNVLGLWMDTIELQDILSELLDKGLEKLQNTDEIKSSLKDNLPEIKEKLKSFDADSAKETILNMMSNMPIDISQPMEIPEEINFDSLKAILKNYTPDSLGNILPKEAMDMMKWLWGLVDEHIL